MSLSGNDLAGARWRSAAVRSFWCHLMTYVLVTAMLVVIGLGTGDGRVLGLSWAFWIILFWGIGVAGQVSSVFGEGRICRVKTRGPHAPRWAVMAIVGLVMSSVHPAIAQEDPESPPETAGDAVPGASCCRCWRSPLRSCCGGRSTGTSSASSSDEEGLS